MSNMASERAQVSDSDLVEPKPAGAAKAPLSLRQAAPAFGAGTVIGALGGLIGLGGAEFRLPLLLGLFRFRALEAVILNKAMSLIVVATALPFRAATVPLAVVLASWPTILNLLAGSLLGAWLGAGWATRLSSRGLYRVIAVLLALIAAALLFGHGTHVVGALVTGEAQIAAGVAAGFVIGVIASLLGVAGGELLIPTLVLLFGADIKLAGSLSLARDIYSGLSQSSLCFVARIIYVTFWPVCIERRFVPFRQRPAGLEALAVRLPAPAYRSSSVRRPASSSCWQRSTSAAVVPRLPMATRSAMPSSRRVCDR